MTGQPIFRTELKYRVSPLQKELLLHRLSAALTPDPHGDGGRYTVRTLYFDSPYDSSLRDNLSGNPNRSKYRLRMYDGDDTHLRLEKKVKHGLGGFKNGVWISRTQCLALLGGDTDWLRQTDDPFLLECYGCAQSGFLRPSCVVAYERTAFECIPGNVRITLDSHIRASERCELFLHTQGAGVPVDPDDACVLEIKFDRFLPDYIAHLVGVGDMPLQAFSKFAHGKLMEY